MCDYSLAAIQSRLAEEGEDLVVHTFSTGTRGFTSLSGWRKSGNSAKSLSRSGLWSRLRRSFLTSGDLTTIPAVCLPQGTRLRLQNIPAHLQKKLNVGPVEDVVFTEIAAPVDGYRDALQFPNINHILLQELEDGQRATVLDVATSEDDEWLKES
jgi:hypothetical protein